jgi:hypothetical protein
MVPGCLGEERIIVTLTMQEVKHVNSERKTQIQFCFISGVDCCCYYCLRILQSVLKSAKPTGRENEGNYSFVRV